MKKILISIALSVALVAQVSAAKSAPQVASSANTKSAGTSRLGVDFSYSESMPHVGVWWHLNNMIALRPTLGFRNQTSTATPGSETSATIFELGLALPIYLAKFKVLDMYVAPAFSFKNTSSKSTTAGVSSSSSDSSFGFGAALGLQLPLHEQFHVFGELGFGYAKDDVKKETMIGLTRTSVGAIFYFN